MTTSDAVKQKGRSGRRRCWGWRIPFIIFGIVLIKSALVMFLWNHLIPDLFQGPVLTYLQAMGLVVLVKILVGHGPRPGWGRGHFGPPWVRGQHMTHEERLKLREELHKRCRHRHQAEEGEHHA